MVASPARKSEACAGTNTIAALLAGGIDANAAHDLELHLDACDTCRRLVADLGRNLATISGASAMPQVGEKIGRFAIGRLIGVGGMGVVYEARDPALGRTVAVKLLRPDVVDGELLLAEAQAMARLQHPNVAVVHDVGRHHGQLYVCMEYVAGTTLRGWLAEQRRSLRDIVDVFAAAGRGLAYVHAAGLAHLDVKPDNILIGGGRVVITDFGLARAHGRKGVAIGTPAYMAPEQRRGDGSPASDQYAFCVSLREAIPAGPRWLRTILARGMAEHADDRFASMDALLDALAAGRRRRRGWLVAGALLGAIALALAMPRSVETVTRVVERPVLRPILRVVTGAEPAGEAALASDAVDVDDPAPIATATTVATHAQIRRSIAATSDAIDEPSVMAATSDQAAARGSRGRATPSLAPPSAPMPFAADCDDGSPLACALRAPTCPATTVASIQSGCWTCADERTCAPLGVPRTCDDASRLSCATSPPVCSGREVPSLHAGCWQCADPFTCPRATTGGAPAHPIECGNRVCERGEDPASCPQDCGGLGGSNAGPGSGSSSGSGAGSGAGSNGGQGSGSGGCGDGVCQASEDHETCPHDCCEPDANGTCKATCGNGRCDAGEDHASCAADCCEVQADGSCAPPCGDGFCDNGESHATCPSDCP